MEKISLNIHKLARGQQVTLNGLDVAYRSCDTRLAYFDVIGVDRQKEFEITADGDVKDWNGYRFIENKPGLFVSRITADEDSPPPNHEYRLSQRRKGWLEP